MKELKYNLKYILNKRELYFALIIIFSISLIHVILCFMESTRLGQFSNQMYTGEYQFILYNINTNFQSILFIVIPIVCSMILSDSSYYEDKLKLTNIFHNRLNYRKNIIVRILFCLILTFLICFICFIFNYVLLRIIFGTGNLVTFYQDVAFHSSYMPDLFLEDVRIANPFLFVVLISISTSFIYGLLSSLAYAVSNFVKNKIIIYFTPLIFIIVLELISYTLNWKCLSVLQFLQPHGAFGIFDYIMCCAFIISIIIILSLIKLRKKDILL